MNGVSMPEDEPTIAHWLGQHNYATGLIGKAHFEPWLGDPELFFENRMASESNTGPHRGFDHMELANHFFEGHSHYDRWMQAVHPEIKERFYPMITEKGQNTASKGDTGAVQVWPMDVPRELYHTDWVADRTIAWLDSLQHDNPFFCWMSFPDPHHPWDIPESEMHRVNWKDVPLPSLYEEDPAKRRTLLEGKPKHWLGYYDGSLWTNLESPREFVPAEMTSDQVREINAITHIENELIDEACGRVLAWLDKQGLRDHTDIFFTTDHGEFQGDYGLMFKGPYHVDALMRLPMIWSPALNANIRPEEVTRPVGHVDLARTFCQVAGINTPDWVQGEMLPISDASAPRDSVITEWDSEHGPVSLHLHSLYRKDGWLVTRYSESSVYEGTEGELYNLVQDPEQRNNLWEDKEYQAVKRSMLEELELALPETRQPALPRLAPV